MICLSKQKSVGVFSGKAINSSEFMSCHSSDEYSVFDFRLACITEKSEAIRDCATFTPAFILEAGVYSYYIWVFR